MFHLLLIKTGPPWWVFSRSGSNLGRGPAAAAVRRVSAVLLRSAPFLHSVVWTLSTVCSFVANPLNARFHSKLFKATAHTRLRNFDLLSVSVWETREGGTTERLCVWFQYTDGYWSKRISLKEDFANTKQTTKVESEIHFLSACTYKKLQIFTRVEMMHNATLSLHQPCIFCGQAKVQLLRWSIQAVLVLTTVRLSPSFGLSCECVCVWVCKRERGA